MNILYLGFSLNCKNTVLIYNYIIMGSKEANKPQAIKPIKHTAASGHRATRADRHQCKVTSQLSFEAKAVCAETKIHRESQRSE